ncbi:MAG: DUF998 domain-containing protein [Candidatus Aenigmatarchaeota archaeon]
MKYYSALCVVSGLLPLAVITVLSFLAKDFTLFENYISDLGVSNYAIVFNASLVIAAILIVPFILHLGKRYNYLKPVFFFAAVAVAGVGIFPSSGPVHWYVSAAFFILTFLTILLSGIKKRSKPSGALSIFLALLCFAGLLIFNPFIETLQVYAIGLWIAAAGLLSESIFGKKG